MHHRTSAARACLVALVTLCSLPGTSAGTPRVAPGAGQSSVLASYDDLVLQANQLFRQRNYEEALKLFKRANGMKGDQSLECLSAIAQIYQRMGAWKSALETVDRAVKLSGEDKKALGSAYNIKGLSLSGQAGERRDKKKYAEAEAAFRQALEADPTLHIAHYNLGMMLMCQELDEQGIEEMKTFLERDPTTPNAENVRRLIADPRRARENFAPDFSTVTLDGSYLNSAELRGKVIVLDFWATWCGPCVASLDDMVRLAKRYATAPVVVVSVSADREQDKWKQFIADNKMAWPQVYDGRGQLQRAFGVRAIPSYFVIDQEGIVREQITGSGRINLVIDAVNKCLKAKPTPPAP